jgi:DNA repair exonuclease SbcCD ATPase subunit
VCKRQHKIRVTCSQRSEGCRKCIQEDKEQERRVKRDLKLEEDRQRRQQEYTRQLQELDDEIEHERRLAKYKVEEEEQAKTLQQRQADLASAKETQKRLKEQEERKKLLATKAALRASTLAARQTATASPPSQTPGSQPSSNAGFDFPQNAKAEWEHLKRFDGASSTPMDDLMEMIGLEDVKQKFLSIKAKVDLTLRQNTSLALDRFSCSMLGNPGTGWYLLKQVRQLLGR